MPTLIVTDRKGAERRVTVGCEQPLMQSLRDRGFDEIEGMCGGCAVCGTCHVYVDPAFAHLLPPAAEAETELLSYSRHVRLESRLACQIKLDDSLDGLCVTIAPAD